MSMWIVLGRPEGQSEDTARCAIELLNFLCVIKE